MAETIVFSGKLSNGIEYQIHQSEGFSNNAEIAIKIKDRFVSVITVIPKRNGNIEVAPMSNGRVTIRAEETDHPAQNQQPEEQDLLSGVGPQIPPQNPAPAKS